MNITELFSLPERRLQHIVRLLLSDTDTIHQTTTGKPLQVISPGEWNVAGGPDFRNMAVLVDGAVTIGDGEFHRRSSEWTDHGHGSDPAYAGLLLHMVLEDNTGGTFAEHTLVLDPRDLAVLLSTVPDAGQTGGMDSEELQEYAYRRLLRKTAEALDMMRNGSAVAAFVLLAQQYLDRRRSSRQRPGGRAALQAIDDRALMHCRPAHLLALVEQDTPMYQPLAETAATKWIAAGTATRMELLVNAFLPAALATASNQARNDLLAWYWSQRAVQRYRSLERRYPAVGQEYIWKQQALLEYAALHRFGPDRVAETDHGREEHLSEAGRRVGMPGAKIILMVEVG